MLVALAVIISLWQVGGGVCRYAPVFVVNLCGSLATPFFPSVSAGKEQHAGDCMLYRASRADRALALLFSCLGCRGPRVAICDDSRQTGALTRRPNRQ